MANLGEVVVVPPDDSAQFAELDDGCGCIELWEYLSERRNDGEE